MSRDEQPIAMARSSAGQLKHHPSIVPVAHAPQRRAPASQAGLTGRASRPKLGGFRGRCAAAERPRNGHKTPPTPPLTPPTQPPKPGRCAAAQRPQNPPKTPPHSRQNQGDAGRGPASGGQTRKRVCERTRRRGRGAVSASPWRFAHPKSRAFWRVAGPTAGGHSPPLRPWWGQHASLRQSQGGAGKSNAQACDSRDAELSGCRWRSAGRRGKGSVGGDKGRR